MTKKHQAKSVDTNRTVLVKPYGSGYIDCYGNFYKAHELQFIRVLE